MRKTKHIKLKILLSIIIILATSGLIIFGIHKNYENKLEKENKIKETIDNIKKQNYDAIKDFSNFIEYGDKWLFEDFMINLVDEDKLSENYNVNFYINNEKVNENEEHIFNIVGEFNLKVEILSNYEKDGNTTKINSEKELNIEVRDTKLPVINGLTKKEITVGDTINLLEGITATDEVDGDLEVTLVNEIDISKAGNYEIEVKATDKNGNETTGQYELVINPKKVTTNNNDNKNTNTNSNNNFSNNNSTSKKDASTKDGRLYLATEEAKRVVKQIITPGMSDEEKAKAITHYIATTVEVQYNQSNEAYRENFGNEAYAALIMKIAACSGRCKAIMLLCSASGLKCEHVNAGKWTHQWNRVLINGTWKVIDSQIDFYGDVHPLEEM